jgi:predicted aldo/keto reductase-like oxidoreductase
MGIFDAYFPLGLGTSRLPISGPDDVAGIEKATGLILKALDTGINYIDTAPPYAAGMAHTALKAAFAATDKPFGVTVKVMHGMDTTADETLRRVEFQLRALDVDKAAFFVCWTISSYDVFRKIMRKGGMYDAALRLKNEGVIKHICCSLHSTGADSIRILESGAFEGATVSHSLLSAIQTLPVLDTALKHGVDIAVMNPLAGGLIAQNEDFFAFARGRGEDTVTAALRFAQAHPAVKIVLSGVRSENEVDRNLAALTENAAERPSERLERVAREIRGIGDFCVNCHYCAGCPQGIPVSELMSGRNKLLFNLTNSYNRSDPELVKNINLLYTHAHLGTGEWFPDSPENPCTRCGKCEKSCTQKLAVMDAVQDTYSRAKRSGFSLSARKARLEELLTGKGYKRVGLYPNGGFATMIVDL